MNAYVLNKISSLVITCGLLVAISLYETIPDSWHLLFIVFTILGYGHYATSAYYQLRTPLYHNHYRYLLWFGIFGLVSITIALFGLLYGLLPYLSLCAIIIFTLHGAFNEPLHDRLLGGYEIAQRWWIGLAFILSGLVVMSSHSQTFFFSPYGMFVFLEPTGLSLQLYEIIHPHVWLGLIGLCFSLGSWFMISTKKLALSIRAGLFLFSIALYAHGLVAGHEYVYWLFALLVYHFVTWLLFSYQHYRGQERRRLNYVTIGTHGVIIGLFVCHMIIPHGVTEYIFSSYVFLVATYFHIITSLINEPWCKQLLKL